MSAFRKTMEFFGFVDEEPITPQTYSSPANVSYISNKRGRVTTPAMQSIVTLHPRSYADARAVAENFREGIPVIMNLQFMLPEDARRVIDFASGLTQGLMGSIQKVTSKVFLLTPYDIIVTGEESNSNTGEIDTTFFRSTAPNAQ